VHVLCNIIYSMDRIDFTLRLEIIVGWSRILP